MPLSYDVQNEVLVDRFVAPTWKRENEPFTHRRHPPLDQRRRPSPASSPCCTRASRWTSTRTTAGLAGDARRVTLKPGPERERVRVPALARRAASTSSARSFEGDERQRRSRDDAARRRGATGAGAAGGRHDAGDTLSDNNVADAFTFVHGKGQVLYVDNVRDGGGARRDPAQGAGRARASTSMPDHRRPVPQQPRRSCRTTTPSSSPTSRAARRAHRRAAGDARQLRPRHGRRAGDDRRRRTVRRRRVAGLASSRKSCPSTWTSPPSGRSARARWCWSCTPARCPTATTGASSAPSRPSRRSPSTTRSASSATPGTGPAAAAVELGLPAPGRRATARASSPPSRRCSWATCPASTTR